MSAESTSYQQSDVTFASSGCILAAWLYQPVNTINTKVAGIVMAPGFTGTRECNYQFISEKFAEAGFAVLLFDYPNFGKSKGTPRGEADPQQQIQAYRDAISYLSTVPFVDANRIGIWGGSYAGGHVIAVTALDKRVKCVVALTPFISGSFYRKAIPAPVTDFMNKLFDTDRQTRSKGGAPFMLPVVSDKPGEMSAFRSKYAWNFVQSFKNYAPSFSNLVTLRSIEMQLDYEPGTYIKQMEQVPKLFIIVPMDDITPAHLIREAYEQAPQPKQLAYIEGNHFSPYMEKREEMCSLAITWFKERL